MKTLILILLTFCFVLGQESKHDIADLLYRGYDVKLRNGAYHVYNNCDTVRLLKSDYSNKDWKEIVSVYRKYVQHRKDFKVYAANTFAVDVGDYTPPVPTTVFYFVASVAKALQGARTGLLGLDSAKVGRSRHSLNQNYIVYRTRILLSDTTQIKTQFAAGNIHYVTWKYCTVDSLRNYLNNLNSVPVWTREID